MDTLYTNLACLLKPEVDLRYQFERALNLSTLWQGDLLFILDEKQKIKLQELVDLISNSKTTTNIDYRFISISSNNVLNVLEELNIDLLMMEAPENKGALERYYEDSLMRNIIRRMECSILIFRHKEEISDYGSIIVNGAEHPKSKYTIQKAKNIGDSLRVKSMLIMNQREKKNAPMLYIGVLDNQVGKLKIETAKVPNYGYKIEELILSKKASLLIMSSPDTKIGFEGRYFSDELDYLITEVPSDILLVHSTRSIS